MRVFRIERKKHLAHTLSGYGAAHSAGNRWNSLTHRMVYTAESRALAYLEVAVHLDVATDFPSDRYLVEIEIPDDIAISAMATSLLPKGWDAKPSGKQTQLLGDAFLKAFQFAVLKVPSSIIPEEHNILINPLHPEARRIKVVSKKKLTFDRRGKN